MLEVQGGVFWPQKSTVCAQLPSCDQCCACNRVTDNRSTLALCRGWFRLRAGVVSTATGDCRARRPQQAPQQRRAMLRATKPHRYITSSSFCLHAAHALNAIRGLKCPDRDWLLWRSLAPQQLSLTGIIINC